MTIEELNRDLHELVESCVSTINSLESNGFHEYHYAVQYYQGLVSAYGHVIELMEDLSV